MPRRTKRDATTQAFGAAVREVRLSRNETLEAVARRIDGMDPKYLGEIERGWHTPSISTAKRIADALEVSLAALVADL